MSDFYIYGDITGEKFFDEDTSAKSFVEKLSEIGDDELIIHVNSAGGDVFAALTIYNALKNFPGKVTAKIDGVAASAASLIVCGAQKVIMAANSLMMIHLPSVILDGSYNSFDLAKARDMLTSIEDAIVETYQKRISQAQNPLNSLLDVRTMLQSETWMNARDAVKWGFADEISEPIDVKVDDSAKILVVNSLKIDMKKFDESKIRRALEVESMHSENISDVRAQEIGRIRSLMKLRGTSRVVDSMIDVAIERGHSVEEIQPYLDAVTNVILPENASPVDKIGKIITDQMNSGAENVAGGQILSDKVAAQQQAIVKFANGGAK